MDETKPIIDVTPEHGASTAYRSKEELPSFFRRRKGLIAFFFLMGCIGGVWYQLTRPTEFEAESRVLISRSGPGGPVAESELASETELIRDRTHIASAASRRVANPSEALRHIWEERIQAGLTVEPAGKSNLISIRYRDSSPSQAAAVVNSVVDLYLIERRQINEAAVSPASVRDGMDPAHAADLLAAFDSVNHGQLLASEADARLRHRLDLESRVAELKASIRETRESAAAMRKHIEQVPDRAQSSTSTSRPGARQPSQIAQTESPNPLKQQLETEAAKTESTIPGLEARLAATQASLAQARAEEERTSTLVAERERLQRRAQQGNATAAALDRSTLRASLISRAESPYEPVDQRLWLRILIGMAAALALAMLLAWFIDWFDSPIYTDDDFERASGLPRAGATRAWGKGAGAGGGR